MQKKEYEKITLENMRDTAIKAARHTIKILYLGKARQVKDGNGNILDHDGNSGADNMISKLYYGFATCAATRNKNGKFDIIATDTDDCISVALSALYENLVNNDGEECDENGFKEACQAVRRYIYMMDTNQATRVRRKYDENGILLRVGDYKYIKYPHLYIDKFEELDEDGNGEQWQIVDVNDELSKYIKGTLINDYLEELKKLLTGAQLTVLHYMAKGYTNTTIAKRMNIDKSGVTRHIQAIRKKAEKLRNEY